MLPSTDETAGQFLSVGNFHNQHLVNQVEQVALALAHVGSLSERRLHRLLNPENSGLKCATGGATRPGCRAGSHTKGQSRSCRTLTPARATCVAIYQ